MGINIQSTQSYISSTILGNIMGSRGQKFKKELDDGSSLQINGKSLNNKNMKAHFDISVGSFLRNWINIFNKILRCTK